MDTSIVVRHAHVADAPVLAADALFRAAFGAQNDAAQVERYCLEHFSPALQADEIDDPAAVTLLAEGGDGVHGFAQMLQNSRPAVAVDVGKTPIELQRFYIAPALHGKGLAHKLMDRCKHEARTRNADVIWLGVWKENPRGIAFYRKAGFEIVAEQPFMLGTEKQFDHIMMHRIV